MEKTFFGKISSGEDTYLYKITDGRISAQVLDFGAALYSLTVPDKNGSLTDVVLFHPDIEQTESGARYIGVTVGRYANRINNSRFSLDGVEYRLEPNNNHNCLHGGSGGFDRRLWKSEEVENGIKFSHFSPDGEDGFPGNLNVSVTYKVENSALIIEYEGVSDKNTPLNMTNHTYFNLNGFGDIKKHKIKMNSDFYTPSDEFLAATGEIKSVSGTKFDLRKETELSEEYDHNFILSDNTDLKNAGTLEGDISGIKMTTYTTMPGVQVYTANFLAKGTPGKNGAKYDRNYGVCLETQYFPGTVNFSHFPSCILKKGETYRHKTVYEFE